ncbi:hypothetical protein NQ176_g7007 [Zarea fungicola]|uniref:Uncharacterized protein n=1 Tax=Zarea fungicola TaxID=93591 RepID=A0ACC1N1C1_9HYPO|nr:hypothetical protein NQ176_g7007 [Lecanicillium fungicola]
MGAVGTSPSRLIQSPIHPSFLPLLDDDFKEYYNLYFAYKPPAHTAGIEAIRSAPKQYSQHWCRDFTFEPFVNDIKILSHDGRKITARVYSPDARTSTFGSGPYPVYINFHGGGYTLGDLTVDAELCMLIRNRVGITVIDVDYRLCPENTFLEGHDDGWAAIQWIHTHGHELNTLPDSISIGGISAGGHISAVCQQLARDAGLPLKLAVLTIPTTTSHLGLTKALDSPYPSFVENELAPCLDWHRMKFFIDNIAPKSSAEMQSIQDRPRFYKSPIEGNLRGVCKTFVATAEFDLVRDEGEAYAQKLWNAGVAVIFRRYTGVPHLFPYLLNIRKAQMYLDDVCAALREAHSQD